MNLNPFRSRLNAESEVAAAAVEPPPAIACDEAKMSAWLYARLLALEDRVRALERRMGVE